MLLYPLGYPVLIESDAPEPLRISAESWGSRQPLFDAPPLRVTIHMQDAPSPSVPPRYQASGGGFTLACDPVTRGEYSIRAHSACLHVSRALLEGRPEWFRYHLLECLVLTALDSGYFVGLHAACVTSRVGVGMLLCGESGSGKSTLAYACARAGWTFISDDSHLAQGENIVTGNAHTIRLRERARELFPELLTKLSVTAPNGKSCIEVTVPRAADFVAARHCVFLSRRPGPAVLNPYSEERAVEYFMGYNTRHDRSGAEQRLREFVRHRTRLLEYESLEDAIAVLEQLP